MRLLEGSAWCVVLLLATGPLLADTPAERASLKGLSAVRVVVDNPGRDAEQYGLTQAALRTDIEGRLKKAGITLLGPDERAQGMPYLHLGLSAFPADGPGDDLFIYSIDLALFQEVRLIRMANVRVSSPTWKAPGTVGTIKANKLATVREIVGQYVDGLIAAHQAVNPK